MRHRLTGLALLTLAWAAGGAARLPAEAPSQPSIPALTAAREAAGGASRLMSVKALRLAGKAEALNQFYGQSPAAKQQFLPSNIQVQMLPPSHFLTVRRRIGMSLVVRTGLAGATLLNETLLPGGQKGGWTGPEAEQAEKSEFARLLLVLLLRTDGALPLTPRAVSNTSVRFTGAGGFDATLHLDPASRLVKELRFNVKMQRDGEIREHVMSIDDRRTVDGIRMPVRLTTSAGGRVLDKLAFDTVDINPPLTPADFTKGGL